MKKKLSILLVVCLLFQSIGIVVYAEESVELEIDLSVESEPISEPVECNQTEEINSFVGEEETDLLNQNETSLTPSDEIPESSQVLVSESVDGQKKEEPSQDTVLDYGSVDAEKVPEYVGEESSIELEASTQEDLYHEEAEYSYMPKLVRISMGSYIFHTASLNKKASAELEEDAVVYVIEGNEEYYKVVYAAEGEKKTGYIKANQAQLVENDAEFKLADESKVEYEGYYLINVVFRNVDDQDIESSELVNVTIVSDNNAISESSPSNQNKDELIQESIAAAEENEDEVTDDEVAIEEAEKVVANETEEVTVETEAVIIEETEEAVSDVTEEVAIEEAEKVVANETEEVTVETEEGVTDVTEEVVDEENEIANETLLMGVAPNDAVYTITPAGVITECISDATDIIIPNTIDVNGTTITVTGISETAFARNTNITSVLLNNALSLTFLAKGCFQNCTALKSFSFNNTITSIDDDMFKGCSSLNSITWPTLLTTIGANAFEDCTSLVSVTLPASVTSIGKEAFQNCTSLVNLNLQNGLTTINSSAFSGCTSLSAIYIPDTVSTVGNSAFENCSAAKVLSLSTAMSAINNFSFSGCSSLEKVIVPASVTQIGRDAFAKCANLKKIEIPSGVETIGGNAFGDIGSDAIVLVYPKGTNDTIGTNAFGNDSTLIAYIGSKTEEYAKNHSGITFYPMDIVDFVKQGYQGILGRSPDEAGLYHYFMELARGSMTGAEFIASLLESEEYSKRGYLYNFSAAITAVFNGMLGRAPASSELNDAKAMMEDGVSIFYIANGISKSTEFITNCNNDYIKPGTVRLVENRDQKYGTSAFVSRCYKLLLGRTYDVEGINGWTGLLLKGNTTGAGIVTEFVRSQEYKNLALSDNEAVRRLYDTMLNRPSPSPSEIAGWVTYLNRGFSIEKVVSGFTESPEYRAKCSGYGVIPGTVTFNQTRDMNMGVTDFVVRCYKQALNRNYDVDGLNGWTWSIITHYRTPAQVAYDFVFSDESLMRNLSDGDFVEMLYQLYLGRSSYLDMTGRNGWLGALVVMTRKAVVEVFQTTEEFRGIVASYGL